MTNEEAIKIIELAIAEVEWNYPVDYAAAFDKAIEALKASPDNCNYTSTFSDDCKTCKDKHAGVCYMCINSGRY